MQEEQAVGIAGPNIIATSVPIRCQIDSRSGGATLVQMSMFSLVMPSIPMPVSRYSARPHRREAFRG